MKEEDIPDKNIFMMCDSLNRSALSQLSNEYIIRSSRKDEIDIWKAFPFDSVEVAKVHAPYMVEYFERTYKEKEKEFFTKTLFVCDRNAKPVATCMVWKAYGEFTTIHWLKVLKEVEGKGIGRALFSIIMESIKEEEYPVYLHTQPGSFRAIKLYSDFGFDILTDEIIGIRKNEIDESMLYLEEFMPVEYYLQLRFRKAPQSFIDRMAKFTTNEF